MVVRIFDPIFTTHSSLKAGLLRDTPACRQAGSTQRMRFDGESAEGPVNCTEETAILHNLVVFGLSIAEGARNFLFAPSRSRDKQKCFSPCPVPLW